MELRYTNNMFANAPCRLNLSLTPPNFPVFKCALLYERSCSLYEGRQWNFSYCWYVSQVYLCHKIATRDARNFLSANTFRKLARATFSVSTIIFALELIFVCTCPRARVHVHVKMCMRMCVEKRACGFLCVYLIHTKKKSRKGRNFMCHPSTQALLTGASKRGAFPPFCHVRGFWLKWRKRRGRLRTKFFHS